MAARREPNTRLRALMAEAELNGGELAREVNTTGVESGMVLSYDRSSVAHWLRGSRPPAEVAVLVAECLSRKLRRRVTVGQTALIGRMNEPLPAGRPTEPAEDIVTALTYLATTGPGRRQVVHSLIYSIAALTPNFAVQSPSPSPIGEPRRTSSQAAAQGAKLLLPLFADADARNGGGHARPALAAYLADTVAPALRAPGSPRERRQLQVEAARLAYLAGFMCFDEGLGGAAQAYYRIAARLFTEAGDLSGYATALRAMSIQAHHLGHRNLALDLAERAADHIPSLSAGHAPQLTAQLAVATAALGDHRLAASRLHRAEVLLDRSDPAGGTIGAYHPAALAYQQAEVLGAVGDLPRAADALAVSLRHRPEHERRARALTLARLAELQLDQGHLDQACTTWTQFLEHRPGLASARATTAVRTLNQRLRPHQHQPGARAVLARSSALRSGG